MVDAPGPLVEIGREAAQQAAAGELSRSRYAQESLLERVWRWLEETFTALLDQSFPKGQALANWLLNVGGSTTKGQLVIRAGQHTVDAANATYAQRWIAVKSYWQLTVTQAEVTALGDMLGTCK